MRTSLLLLHNGTAVPLAAIPRLGAGPFLQELLDAIDRGWRTVSYFAAPGGDDLSLYALLAAPADSLLGVMATRVSDVFPSMARLCPQLALFEREMAEQFGIIFDDHPRFTPLRFHRSFRSGTDAWQRDPAASILPSVMEFYRVEGEEVHEVAVGPVHAGIIEPGHFRFQCHGETVFHLEISLGYQHRGIEAVMPGGPHPSTIHQMETVAGDTTVGHALAHCLLLEALGGVRVPARAEAIRGIAQELERLANHTGDLGALAGDVGYLPTASFCGRIRGDFLNMTAELCGSRFGRGLLRPGGVRFDISPAIRDALLARLAAARTDLTTAVTLLWETPSVMGRFEATGPVSREVARELGLVGPAARASGLNRDVRRDHPYGIFQMSQIPVATATTGDVHGRALVRWLEAEKSLDFLEEQLRQLPAGPCRMPAQALAGDSLAVALTEGWRGEVCHVAITDATGRLARYKVTDPSFHNWSGLAMALRNQQISDFPLCNKSFNLSYCGFDL